MPQPAVGRAPARWGRFDPPCLLLLALPALAGFAGGGLLSGDGGRRPTGRVRRRVRRPGASGCSVRSRGPRTRDVAVRRSRSTPASSSATAVEPAGWVARVRCPPVGAQLGVHGLVELGARLFGALVRRVGVALGVADLVGVGVGVGDRASDVGVDRVFDAASVQPHHLRLRAPRGRWAGRAGRGASVRRTRSARRWRRGPVAGAGPVARRRHGRPRRLAAPVPVPGARRPRPASGGRLVSDLSAASRSTTRWRASSQLRLASTSSPLRRSRSGV